MDFFLKLLFLSGKYLTQITAQSIIEAYNRSMRLRHSLGAKFEKQFQPISPYENILELYNENITEISKNAQMQMAFISDAHKKEFESYLREIGDEGSLKHLQRFGHKRMLSRKNSVIEDQFNKIEEEIKNDSLKTAQKPMFNNVIPKTHTFAFQKGENNKAKVLYNEWISKKSKHTGNNSKWPVDEDFQNLKQALKEDDAILHSSGKQETKEKPAKDEDALRKQAKRDAWVHFLKIKRHEWLHSRGNWKDDEALTKLRKSITDYETIVEEKLEEKERLNSQKKIEKLNKAASNDSILTLNDDKLFKIRKALNKTDYLSELRMALSKNEFMKLREALIKEDSLLAQEKSVRNDKVVTSQKKPAIPDEELLKLGKKLYEDNEHFGHDLWNKGRSSRTNRKTTRFEMEKEFSEETTLEDYGKLCRALRGDINPNNEKSKENKQPIKESIQTSVSIPDDLNKINTPGIKLTEFKEAINIKRQEKEETSKGMPINNSVNDNKLIGIRKSPRKLERENSIRENASKLNNNLSPHELKVLQQKVKETRDRNRAEEIFLARNKMNARESGDFKPLYYKTITNKKLIASKESPKENTPMDKARVNITKENDVELSYQMHADLLPDAQNQSQIEETLNLNRIYPKKTEDVSKQSSITALGEAIRLQTQSNKKHYDSIPVAKKGREIQENNINKEASEPDFGKKKTSYQFPHEIYSDITETVRTQIEANAQTTAYFKMTKGESNHTPPSNENETKVTVEQTSDKITEKAKAQTQADIYAMKYLDNIAIIDPVETKPKDNKKKEADKETPKKQILGTLSFTPCNYGKYRNDSMNPSVFDECQTNDVPCKIFNQTIQRKKRAAKNKYKPFDYEDAAYIEDKAVAKMRNKESVKFKNIASKKVQINVNKKTVAESSKQELNEEETPFDFAEYFKNRQNRKERENRLKLLEAAAKRESSPTKNTDVKAKDPIKDPRQSFRSVWPRKSKKDESVDELNIEPKNPFMRKHWSRLANTQPSNQPTKVAFKDNQPRRVEYIEKNELQTTREFNQSLRAKTAEENEVNFPKNEESSSWLLKNIEEFFKFEHRLRDKDFEKKLLMMGNDLRDMKKAEEVFADFEEHLWKQTMEEVKMEAHRLTKNVEAFDELEKILNMELQDEHTLHEGRIQFDGFNLKKNDDKQIKRGNELNNMGDGVDITKVSADYFIAMKDRQSDRLDKSIEHFKKMEQSLVDNESEDNYLGADSMEKENISQNIKNLKEMTEKYQKMKIIAEKQIAENPPPMFDEVNMRTVFLSDIKNNQERTKDTSSKNTRSSEAQDKSLKKEKTVNKIIDAKTLPETKASSKKVIINKETKQNDGTNVGISKSKLAIAKQDKLFGSSDKVKPARKTPSKGSTCLEDIEKAARAIDDRSKEIELSLFRQINNDNLEVFLSPKLVEDVRLKKTTETLKELVKEVKKDDPVLSKDNLQQFLDDMAKKQLNTKVAKDEIIGSEKAKPIKMLDDGSNNFLKEQPSENVKDAKVLPKDGNALKVHPNNANICENIDLFKNEFGDLGEDVTYILDLIEKKMVDLDHLDNEDLHKVHNYIKWKLSSRGLDEIIKEPEIIQDIENTAKLLKVNDMQFRKVMRNLTHKLLNQKVDDRRDVASDFRPLFLEWAVKVNNEQLDSEAAILEANRKAFDEMEEHNKVVKIINGNACNKADDTKGSHMLGEQLVNLSGSKSPRRSNDKTSRNYTTQLPSCHLKNHSVIPFADATEKLDLDTIIEQLKQDGDMNSARSGTSTQDELSSKEIEEIIKFETADNNVGVESLKKDTEEEESAETPEDNKKSKKERLEKILATDSSTFKYQTADALLEFDYNANCSKQIRKSVSNSGYVEVSENDKVKVEPIARKSEDVIKYQIVRNYSNQSLNTKNNIEEECSKLYHDIKPKLINENAPAKTIHAAEKLETFLCESVCQELEMLKGNDFDFMCTNDENFWNFDNMELAKNMQNENTLSNDPEIRGMRIKKESQASENKAKKEIDAVASQNNDLSNFNCFSISRMEELERCVKTSYNEDKQENNLTPMVIKKEIEQGPSINSAIQNNATDVGGLKSEDGSISLVEYRDSMEFELDAADNLFLESPPWKEKRMSQDSVNYTHLDQRIEGDKAMDEIQISNDQIPTSPLLFDAGMMGSIDAIDVEESFKDCGIVSNNSNIIKDNTSGHDIEEVSPINVNVALQEPFVQESILVAREESKTNHTDKRENLDITTLRNKASNQKSKIDSATSTSSTYKRPSKDLKKIVSETSTNVKPTKSMLIRKSSNINESKLHAFKVKKAAENSMGKNVSILSIEKQLDKPSNAIQKTCSEVEKSITTKTCNRQQSLPNLLRTVTSHQVVIDTGKEMSVSRKSSNTETILLHLKDIVSSNSSKCFLDSMNNEQTYRLNVKRGKDPRNKQSSGVNQCVNSGETNIQDVETSDVGIKNSHTSGENDNTSSGYNINSVANEMNSVETQCNASNVVIEKKNAFLSNDVLGRSFLERNIWSMMGLAVNPLKEMSTSFGNYYKSQMALMENIKSPENEVLLLGEEVSNSNIIKPTEKTVTNIGGNKSPRMVGTNTTSDLINGSCLSGTASAVSLTNKLENNLKEVKSETNLNDISKNKTSLNDSSKHILKQSASKAESQKSTGNQLEKSPHFVIQKSYKQITPSTTHPIQAINEPTKKQTLTKFNVVFEKTNTTSKSNRKSGEFKTKSYPTIIRKSKEMHINVQSNKAIAKQNAIENKKENIVNKREPSKIPKYTKSLERANLKKKESSKSIEVRTTKSKGKQIKMPNSQEDVFKKGAVKQFHEDASCKKKENATSNEGMSEREVIKCDPIRNMKKLVDDLQADLEQKISSQCDDNVTDNNNNQFVCTAKEQDLVTQRSAKEIPDVVNWKQGISNLLSKNLENNDEKKIKFELSEEEKRLFTEIDRYVTCKKNMECNQLRENVSEPKLAKRDSTCKMEEEVLSVSKNKDIKREKTQHTQIFPKEMESSITTVELENTEEIKSQITISVDAESGLTAKKTNNVLTSTETDEQFIDINDSNKCKESNKKGETMQKNVKFLEHKAELETFIDIQINNQQYVKSDESSQAVKHYTKNMKKNQQPTENVSPTHKEETRNSSRFVKNPNRLTHKKVINAVSANSLNYPRSLNPSRKLKPQIMSEHNIRSKAHEQLANKPKTQLHEKKKETTKDANVQLTSEKATCLSNENPRKSETRKVSVSNRQSKTDAKISSKQANIQKEVKSNENKLSVGVQAGANEQTVSEHIAKVEESVSNMVESNQEEDSNLKTNVNESKVTKEGHLKNHIKAKGEQLSPHRKVQDKNANTESRASEQLLSNIEVKPISEDVNIEERISDLSNSKNVERSGNHTEMKSQEITENITDAQQDTSPTKTVNQVKLSKQQLSAKTIKSRSREEPPNMQAKRKPNQMKDDDFKPANIERQTKSEPINANVNVEYKTQSKEVSKNVNSHGEKKDKVEHKAQGKEVSQKVNTQTKKEENVIDEHNEVSQNVKAQTKPEETVIDEGKNRAKDVSNVHVNIQTKKEEDVIVQDKHHSKVVKKVNTHGRKEEKVILERKAKNREVSKNISTQTKKEETLKQTNAAGKNQSLPEKVKEEDVENYASTQNQNTQTPKNANSRTNAHEKVITKEERVKQGVTSNEQGSSKQNNEQTTIEEPQISDVQMKAQAGKECNNSDIQVRSKDMNVQIKHEECNNEAKGNSEDKRLDSKLSPKKVAKETVDLKLEAEEYSDVEIQEKLRRILNKHTDRVDFQNKSAPNLTGNVKGKEKLNEFTKKSSKQKENAVVGNHKQNLCEHRDFIEKVKTNLKSLELESTCKESFGTDNLNGLEVKPKNSDEPKTASFELETQPIANSHLKKISFKNFTLNKPNSPQQEGFIEIAKTKFEHPEITVYVPPPAAEETTKEEITTKQKEAAEENEKFAFRNVGMIQNIKKTVDFSPIRILSLNSLWNSKTNGRFSDRQVFMTTSRDKGAKPSKEAKEVVKAAKNYKYETKVVMSAMGKPTIVTYLVEEENVSANGK